MYKRQPQEELAEADTADGVELLFFLLQVLQIPAAAVAAIMTKTLDHAATAAAASSSSETTGGENHELRTD